MNLLAWKTPYWLIHPSIHSFIACPGRLGMNKEYEFGKVLTCILQWKNLRSGFYGPVLDLGCNNYIIILNIFLSYHIILYYILTSILSKQLTQSVPCTLFLLFFLVGSLCFASGRHVGLHKQALWHMLCQRLRTRDEWQFAFFAQFGRVTGNLSRGCWQFVDDKIVS